MSCVSVDALLGGSVLTPLSTWLQGYSSPQRVLTPAVSATCVVVVPGGDPAVSGDRVAVYPNSDGSGVPLAQPLTADADGRFPGYVVQPAALDVKLSGPRLTSRTLRVGTPVDPDAVKGSPPAPSWLLVVWTLAEVFAVSSVMRDAAGLIESADLAWPDGATGVWATDATSAGVDAYHVTYVWADGSRTVTQPAVTRAADGSITDQPALVVS